MPEFDYGQVILPNAHSLESLAITLAELYNMTVQIPRADGPGEPSHLFLHTTKKKCYTDHCTPYDTVGCGNAIACATYLYNLDTSMCGAGAEPVTVCGSNNYPSENPALIQGINYTRFPTSSCCRGWLSAAEGAADAAAGEKWGYNECELRTSVTHGAHFPVAVAVTT